MSPHSHTPPQSCSSPIFMNSWIQEIASIFPLLFCPITDVCLPPLIEFINCMTVPPSTVLFLAWAEPLSFLILDFLSNMTPLWFHSPLCRQWFSLYFTPCRSSSSFSPHKLTNLEHISSCDDRAPSIRPDHLFIYPLLFSARKPIMYEMHRSWLHFSPSCLPKGQWIGR